MKFSYIKKLIITGTAGAICISGCNSGGGSSNVNNANAANTKTAGMNSSNNNETLSSNVGRSNSTTDEKNIHLGLMGHYFVDSNFVDQLFQIHHKYNQFSLNKDTLNLLHDMHAGEQTEERRNVYVKSIYWNGYIKFDTDITTQLVFVRDYKNILPRVQIYIDNTLVNEKPFKFIAGRYYKLKIAIPKVTSLSKLTEINLKLMYIDNGYNMVPDKNLFEPNSKPAMIRGIQGYSSADDKDDELKRCALSGFAMVPESATITYKCWYAKLYSQRLEKFYSNIDPDYDSKNSTTLGNIASPWTDQEKLKAFGKPDTLGIGSDAMNPVVAAYPIIKPLINKVSVTVAETIAYGFSNTTTTGTESRITNTTVDEVTNSHTISLGANIGYSSKEGLNGGGSFGYDHSWGQSTTTTKGSDSSNSFSLSKENNSNITINTGDTAKLVIYTSFKNTGTASISGMLPMLNIGTLPKSADSQKINSITSIYTNTSQKIENISPWATYPNDGSSFVDYTKDSFGGSDLTLNVEQYKSITSGDPIVVSMPQLSTSDSSGKDINWQKTIDSIQSNTALFILRTPIADIERRVFGLQEQTADLQKLNYPELTISDAFYAAFKLTPPTLPNSRWNYDQSFNIKNDHAKYSFESLVVIGDQNAYTIFTI